MKKSYISMLEEACNARENLDEARSWGAGPKTIDRLQKIYSDKAYRMIKSGGDQPPEKWELIERALKSLGF